MNNWYVLEQLAAADQQWRLRQAEKCQLITRCSRESPAPRWRGALRTVFVPVLRFAHRSLGY